MIGTLASCGSGLFGGKDSNKSKPQPRIDTCVMPTMKLRSFQAIFDKSGQEMADSEVNSEEVDWTLLVSSTEDHKHWSGVGLLGGCTGSLLDSGVDDAPAYILTNGHCLGSGSSVFNNEVIINQEPVKSLTMVFRYYNDLLRADLLDSPYKVSIVRYASMVNTDVAVVELEGVTLGQLKSECIMPYKVAANRVADGTRITNIGVPQSYVHRQNLGLRQSFCTVGGGVKLMEGPFSFSDSFWHQCSLVGGSSGSPVFDVESGEIVAVMNTAVNDSAEDEEDCSLNKPCELNGDEVVVRPERNYGQYVDFISKCFDNGIFDAMLASCELPQ